MAPIETRHIDANFKQARGSRFSLKHLTLWNSMEWISFSAVGRSSLIYLLRSGRESARIFFTHALCVPVAKILDIKVQK